MASIICTSRSHYDVYQQDVPHPLRFLPYTDSGAPQIRIDGVNVLNSLRPIVSLSASSARGAYTSTGWK